MTDKLRFRKLFVFIACALLTSVLSACALVAVNRSPKAKNMETLFNDNQEDIATISNYLLSESQAYIVIDDSSGTMLTGSADSPLSKTTIKNEDVLSSIQLIFQKGCNCIIKDLANNSVVFEFWHQSIGSVSSGIVYAPNIKAEPNVEFMTEITPLNDNGWYYYLSDYEQWRIDREQAQDG